MKGENKTNATLTMLGAVHVWILVKWNYKVFPNPFLLCENMLILSSASQCNFEETEECNNG